jgi:hypothetical protein
MLTSDDVEGILTNQRFNRLKWPAVLILLEEAGLILTQKLLDLNDKIMKGDEEEEEYEFEEEENKEEDVPEEEEEDEDFEEEEESKEAEEA